MTRDCRQHRDDQRLRTVQEMTADLWGEQVTSKNNSAEVRAGTCQIQVPAPQLPKVSSHLHKVLLQS
ncbi:unnamed protein product [Staurois parvus]|uniref:Uncharacterized protein n=1 Tax=Staurois parvus TaxID=386267 RepID=A0ABN9E8T6_9NEOB|nr:unnamed protein product [Staurois parvus]